MNYIISKVKSIIAKIKKDSADSREGNEAQGDSGTALFSLWGML